MVKEEGYYVFTPLHGERLVRIHRADCRWAHVAPDHPDRDESCDVNPVSWPRHLANVEAAAATTLRAERIPLWDNAFANLYIMACR